MWKDSCGMFKMSFFAGVILNLLLLIRHVKGLVGELDFSFHAVSTADAKMTHSRMTSRAPSRVSVNETQAADRNKTD